LSAGCVGDLLIAVVLVQRLTVFWQEHLRHNQMVALQLIAADWTANISLTRIADIAHAAAVTHISQFGSSTYQIEVNPTTAGAGTQIVAAAARSAARPSPAARST
jgi:hypothetical protein